MQLLGEEVDTEVAVLSGGPRGRNADDLARTALEHQDVAHADVVAGDSDSVWDGGGAAGRATNFTGHLNIMVVMDVVVVVGKDLVCHFVQTVAEGVVVSVFVVISHS